MHRLLRPNIDISTPEHASQAGGPTTWPQRIATTHLLFGQYFAYFSSCSLDISPAMKCGIQIHGVFT